MILRFALGFLLSLFALVGAIIVNGGEPSLIAELPSLAAYGPKGSARALAAIFSKDGEGLGEGARAGEVLPLLPHEGQRRDRLPGLIHRDALDPRLP